MLSEILSVRTDTKVMNQSLKSLMVSTNNNYIIYI